MKEDSIAQKGDLFFFFCYLSLLNGEHNFFQKITSRFPQCLLFRAVSNVLSLEKERVLSKLTRQASHGQGSIFNYFLKKYARMSKEGNHPCLLQETLAFKSQQDDVTKNISTVHSKYYFHTLSTIPFFIWPLQE